MSAKVGKFPHLILVGLCLLPAAAVAQGSVGPLQQPVVIGPAVTSSARAGSLAFFTTMSPPDPYAALSLGFVRSDGTFQGTFSIDPRGPANPPGQGHAEIRFADSLGSLLFFSCAKHSAVADRGLWRTNGTGAGTFPVTQGLSLAMDSRAEVRLTMSVPERNLELFSAGLRSASPDFELWATDGTLAGTRLVKDVNPEGPSNPRRMIAVGGQLFFLADTPQGRQLWRSDGTPEGTERVHDFPDEDGLGNLDLVQAGGALFVVEETASGVKVWHSDGTEAGTTQALDLPHQLRELEASGRHLFLVARDAAGNSELWAVDGGTGEAVRVLQTGSAPDFQLLAVGNHVAFRLEDDHGLEPWWSDGTPEGTHRVADLCPGPCSSLGSISVFAGTYRGRAVLRVHDGVSFTGLWLTDGTAAGTWRLADFCSGDGECDAFPQVQEINGWLVLLLWSDGAVKVSDGTPDGAWSLGNVHTLVDLLPLPDRLLIAHYQAPIGFVSSLPVTAPAPPPGAWLESARLPGFRVKVQVGGQLASRQEPACMARTLCVSGAVPGRSEIFLRMPEPTPEGRIQPALVKLTTSAADVWVLQTATGYLRHYRLPASDPTGSALSGLLDREGFLSAPGGPAPAIEGARAGKDPQPPGRWIESKAVPGFRVQARLTAGGKSQILRKEACVAETFCLSGATPGVTELLIRVTGPKPNGYYWPMLARFAPAALEVWIQQRSTGKIRYYRLNAPPAGSSQLDGYVDRLGFKR